MLKNRKLFLVFKVGEVEKKIRQINILNNKMVKLKKKLNQGRKI